jgi:fluoroquinolone transport system permease protein
MDLKVQGRNRFPHIYLALTLLYALILRLTPLARAAELVLPLMLFSEPSMLGLILTGAHHHFEQTQGASAAVAVTPLRVREYVFGRAVSISLLSTAAALLLSALGLGTVDSRVMGLGPVVFLAATAFGLLGVGLAAGFRDFLTFVFAVMGVQTLLFVPAAAVLGLMPRAWFLWLPSAPALYAMQDVMLRAYGAPPYLSYWWYLGLLAVWTAMAARWAERRYSRLVRGYGSGRPADWDRSISNG